MQPDEAESDSESSSNYEAFDASALASDESMFEFDDKKELAKLKQPHIKQKRRRIKAQQSPRDLEMALFKFGKPRIVKPHPNFQDR